MAEEEKKPRTGRGWTKKPGQGRPGFTSVQFWMEEDLREEMKALQAETGLSRGQLLNGAFRVYLRNRKDGFEIGNGGMDALGKMIGLLSQIAYRMEHPVQIRRRLGRVEVVTKETIQRFDPQRFTDDRTTPERLRELRVRRAAVRKQAKAQKRGLPSEASEKPVDESTPTE